MIYYVLAAGLFSACPALVLVATSIAVVFQVLGSSLELLARAALEKKDWFCGTLRVRHGVLLSESVVFSPAVEFVARSRALLFRSIPRLRPRRLCLLRCGGGVVVSPRYGSHRQLRVAEAHRTLWRSAADLASCPTTSRLHDGQRGSSSQIADSQHSVNIVLFVPCGINGTIRASYPAFM